MRELSELPEGWRLIQLRDVASLRMRQVKPAKGDSTPYVALEHIVSGGSLNGYGEAGDSISNKTIFHSGDILYGKLRPNLRKVVRANFDGVCSTDILAVLARDPCNADFLSHVIRSDLLHAYAMRGTAGTKMPRTSWKHLQSFHLPLPPMAEQRAIAAVLDAIDKAIERTEAVISVTERLRDALLHELLTRGIPGWHTKWKDVPGLSTIPADWEVVQLGDVAKATTSGSRAWSRYFCPDGALFVRSQNILGSNIDRSDSVFVRPPADAEATRSRIHKGDILISITGEPGKVAVADGTLGAAYVSQHVALVRLNDSGLSDFVGEFLNGRISQDSFRKIRYGQTRPGLNLIDVNNTKVALPSSPERNMIALLGKSLKVLVKENIVELNQLRSLKASASDALLTGRVKVSA